MKSKYKKLIPECLFVLVLLGFMIALARVQSFGDPPDEINRFKVVYYICNHGRLPIGSDPEVILDGYGASYAFQPILTYMIQGWLLRFLHLFTADSFTLIFAARLVNVTFGVLTAVFVRKIAKLIWVEELNGWLFSLLVMFLPQHLFLYTYVNTDAMALFGTALILYYLLLGNRDRFAYKTCAGLAVGVILVGMSYYNAYGIVLVAMIWFVLSFAQRKAYKEMVSKGGMIVLIVLLGMGWWFIRNGILYDGDILGMEARRICAMETALPDYNPLTRFTYQKAGIPILTMLTETDYVTLTWQSFIAMFGAMNIPTHGLFYIFYKRLYVILILCLLIPLFCGTHLDKKERIRMDALLLFDILITMGLHLYYSYTWEFQPQGRYLMPMVFAVMFFLTMGIVKLEEGMYFMAGKVAGRMAGADLMVKKLARILVLLGKTGIALFVLFVFCYTLLLRVIPAYPQGAGLDVMHSVPFTDIMP